MMTTFMLLALLIGCQSSPEGGGVDASSANDRMIVASADDGSQGQTEAIGTPKFTQTLPDGMELSVYSAQMIGDIIQIEYTYSTDQVSSGRRFLQLDTDGSSLFIQDESHRLLTGYTLKSQPHEIALTMFSEEVILRLKRPPDGDDPIYVMFGSNDLSQTADFPGMEALDSAAVVFDNVNSGMFQRQNLSPIDSALLARAEMVHSWAPYFDAAFSENDLRSGHNLARNEAFREWLSDQKDLQPLLDVPDLIRLICKFVPIVKRVCHWLGGGQICELIEIMEMVCNVLKEENILR